MDFRRYNDISVKVFGVATTAAAAAVYPPDIALHNNYYLEREREKKNTRVTVEFLSARRTVMPVVRYSSHGIVVN